MKKSHLPIAILCLILLPFIMLSCKSQEQMVRAGADGQFYIGQKPYKFVGVNMWYGAILGSQGEGGDRQRLKQELNLLKKMGIDNLRVLVGADGEGAQKSQVRPILQSSPGVYNPEILDGLDYLIAELEKRGMKAVLYLNNAWEWSGGYGAYLEWAGEGRCPDPQADGYRTYVEHVSKFVHNDSAKAMAMRHAKNIAGRKNGYTGKPYSQSPAIMAWEIANEPRSFRRDSISKQKFYDWLIDMARAIKSVDSQHMVATGSEGMFGSEYDMKLWARIHNSPEIDYAIVHAWPYNWRWINAETSVDSAKAAVKKTERYIMMHAEETTKPLVLEEFGYPRDSMQYALDSSTTGRDEYFRGVFELISRKGVIAGCNIWGWGGLAIPKHQQWEEGDPYTGDPAQEAQGLNSVFAGDSSTIAIMKEAARQVTKSGKR